MCAGYGRAGIPLAVPDDERPAPVREDFPLRAFKPESCVLSWTHLGPTHAVWTRLSMPEPPEAPCPERSKANGETRTRTGDTTIFSRVLYQLSYLAVVGLRPGPMLPARCGRARALSSVPGRCSEAPLVLALRCAHLPACSQASRYGSGSIVCPPGAYQPPTHISKCRCGALASPVRPARHSVWPAATACPALTASVAA
jgi:hypothetical protein